jgi:hypothetical protein
MNLVEKKRSTYKHTQRINLVLIEAIHRLGLGLYNPGVPFGQWPGKAWMSPFVAIHKSFVYGSGRAIKDAMASPVVIKGCSSQKNAAANMRIDLKRQVIITMRQSCRLN